MQRNLLRYIWNHSRKQQIWIFIVVLASMPVYFQMLQLPKLIVNGPIQGVGFDTPNTTQTILSFNLPFSEYFFGQSIVLFNGVQLDRQAMLIVLCLGFLVAVALNGWFKLYINTFKGKLGERLLRRLRYELFDRVLRYPIAKVRRVKPSEITSVIKDEVEPLGEFFGDAFSAPVFLGAQALTGLTFLFLQSTMFGVITLAIVLFQAWIIPRLRRRLLELGRMRQASARKLSGRIGEYVQGMDDVHLHGVSNRARSNIWGMLKRILVIRFELYQRKFQVKFLNNFLIQFLAFLFYLVGGYLVITGRLDIGALVASIAAYKDLPSPIKGIIDWDQKRLLNQIRYEQAIDDFASTKIVSSELQADTEKPPAPIKDGFALEGVTVLDSHDQPIIENFSNAVTRREAVAIVGSSDSGAEQVAEMLARLLLAGSGKISLDDQNLETLPEVLTGQRIGYADSSTFFAGGTVKSTLAETLPFSGKTPPIIDSASSGADFKHFEMENLNIKPETMIEEADAYDEFSNWPDEETSPRLLSIMQTVGLYDDILEYGLLRKLDDDAGEDVKARIMDARSRFASDKTTQKIAEAVEFFDPQKYSHQLTIGENLIFGTPVDDSFGPKMLPSNVLIRKILNDNNLLAPLFDVGLEIARNNIELFGDLAEDSLLLQRSGGPSPEHLLEMKQAVEDLAGKTAATADSSHLEAMLGLAFDYCEAQTRFGLVDEGLQERLLTARNKLQEAVKQQDGDAIAFHDPERFNSSLTVLDNILFGRIDARRIGARERVLKSIKALIESCGVSDTVFSIGLSFDIGTGGRNLSTNQAQKLKLVRALLKKPDIVILNRALSALDAKERLKIIHDIVSMEIHDGQRQMGVIYVPLDNNGLEDFDRILLMEHGRIAAEGTPDKISDRLESAAQ
ncbi:ABC transporter transmembrane domain-containing protein [Hoeflea sp. TYP-13]|uniref:ABC transporter transmembrane domain-containing protein n=1 Tax=Hoeflea sp. TYP-13 TaxID=3230023 RepID=UPI0034C5C2E9